MTKSEIVRKLTEAYFDLAPEEMPSLRECMQFYAELKEKELREASGLSQLLVEQIKSYGRVPGNPLNPTAFAKITTEKEEEDGKVH